jgi:hypothetical protein
MRWVLTFLHHAEAVRIAVIYLHHAEAVRIAVIYLHHAEAVRIAVIYLHHAEAVRIAVIYLLSSSHLADACKIALIIDSKGMPQLAKYRRAIVLKFELDPLLAFQMVLCCLSAAT